MKLLYGFNDPENAIECELIETKYIDGDFYYIARCDGGKIQAQASFFQTFFCVAIKNADGIITRNNNIYAATPEEAIRQTILNCGESVKYVTFA